MKIIYMLSFVMYFDEVDTFKNMIYNKNVENNSKQF